MWSTSTSSTICLRTEDGTSAGRSVLPFTSEVTFGGKRASYAKTRHRCHHNRGCRSRIHLGRILRRLILHDDSPAPATPGAFSAVLCAVLLFRAALGIACGGSRQLLACHPRHRFPQYQRS